MQRDSDHIREIEAIATQRGASPRDPIVLASWLRCLDTHGLDPTARREAHIVTAAELRAHRQRSEALIGIARSGIDNLYKLVAGQNYVLLLSDAQGVTVEYLGEDRHKDALRQSGLFIGAEWSEARAGTCAVGACIEAGEPLIIHQSDHFDVTHGSLSCTAAPIYDTQGRLSAVLDISLLSSPQPRESQVLALNLVRQAARRIEMANLMAESRRDWVLRLSGSPDFLDVDPEAAVSLDANGQVIGLTNAATRLMARALGADWRDANHLIGRHISEVFDLDMTMLEGLTRQTPASDRFIETRDGYRLFGHAIEPRNPTPPPARRPRHLPIALRSLAGDDPAQDRLLERAADLAHGRLPLLLTGETGTGKTTLARAIHALGGRGPCVAMACESFDETEAAAIFGREDRRTFDPGLIAEAEGGTLILENLDELPERFQARLMMLVAEGRYRPIGALRDRPSTARVIATSTDTDRLRRDLALRLAGTRLDLIPLRDRADRLTLLDRALRKACAAPVALDPAALAACARYDWPGNLHELTQLADGLGAARATTLHLADLPKALRARAPARPDSARAILVKHLTETDWNISETARRMGVDRSTIYRRITRLRLAREG